MALEHGDLVAQDLSVFGAGEQGKPAEQTEHRQISEPWCHGY
jgi:hypothetical protein